jgi:hypothetical protein
MFLKKIRSLIKLVRNLKYIEDRVENANILLGNIKSDLNNNKKIKNLNEVEFKVFSQWGEDGIIDYLIENLFLKNDYIFIEIGVENYLESNTRYLLIKRNWTGLLIEKSQEDVEFIKKDSIYWKHDLTVLNAFVTKKNINELILANINNPKKIGLLSIDIDGNDYWIWEALNSITPSVVVIEYSSRLGKENSEVIPKIYDEQFERTKYHYSNIAYGASLKALIELANQKNYFFAGSNSAGTNAFFIRKDLQNEKIKPVSLEEGFVQSKIRESRNKEGKKIFLSLEEEKKIIESLK